MNKLTKKIFESSASCYFTSQDVSTLFPVSENARHALIKRAIANGEIVHLRRGLYCLAPKYRKKSVSQYVLAQHIYGPSYISLESALHWYGWIPEAVYTLTSVSLKKTSEFQTPLGAFSFTRVPQTVFYTGRCTGDGAAVNLPSGPTSTGPCPVSRETVNSASVGRKGRCLRFGWKISGTAWRIMITVSWQGCG